MYTTLAEGQADCDEQYRVMARRRLKRSVKNALECPECEGRGYVRDCIDGFNPGSLYGHTQEEIIRDCGDCHGTGAAECAMCGDEASEVIDGELPLCDNCKGEL